ALPWAALGYAVIAPDYAALGTPGVQGYVDNHDTGYSMLDGARALRKMLPAGAFSSKVVMAGHSQGGGGALSAQALAKTYGLDGDLVAVAVFAPEWPTRLDSFGYVSMLQSPNDLTITTGISNNVVAAYREYGYFSNYVTSSNGMDAFPSAQAAIEVSTMNALDEVGFGGYLHGVDLHLGDMFDSGFRTSLVSCIAGTSGCNAREAAYLSFLQQNILTADASGAKVLYVQGLAYIVMSPAQEGACNVLKLQNDGVTPTVCVDASGQHTDVTSRNISYGISWVQSVLSGATPPACSSSSALPTCSP
ncbi:MAG: lipase family protein, partial [Polyangiaceae bacterium]